MNVNMEDELVIESTIDAINRSLKLKLELNRRQKEVVTIREKEKKE